MLEEHHFKEEMWSGEKNDEVATVQWCGSSVVVFDFFRDGSALIFTKNDQLTTYWKPYFSIKKFLWLTFTGFITLKELNLDCSSP